MEEEQKRHYNKNSYFEKIDFQEGNGMKKKRLAMALAVAVTIAVAPAVVPAVTATAAIAAIAAAAGAAVVAAAEVAAAATAEVAAGAAEAVAAAATTAADQDDDQNDPQAAGVVVPHDVFTSLISLRHPMWEQGKMQLGHQKIFLAGPNFSA